MARTVGGTRTPLTEGELLWLPSRVGLDYNHGGVHSVDDPADAQIRAQAAGRVRDAGRSRRGGLAGPAGPHAGYAGGVLGPLILAGIRLGMVIAPSINTGTFGVALQDAGVASATATVGQQLGASVDTSLLNTIFAAVVTSYLTAHLAAARLIGRQALTRLALAHGYDTAFWWTAGIFAGGAVIGGTLLRPGPLVQKHTVPGRPRGDNGTDQGESHSSGVRLRPTRKSPEPGDSRSP